MRKVSVIAITATYLDMTFAITANITSVVETGDYFVRTVICTIIWASFPMSHVDDMRGDRMDDYISRQAAVDICANAIDLWHGQIGEGALVAVRDKIAELTPAEPKEGRWIEISSITHTYKCSVCGRLLVNVADGRNNVSKHYPYCHCGADMRGEQNG